MATAVADATPPASKLTSLPGAWVRALLQDLEPVPGRLGSTMRVVLASVIALLLLEVLQMPFLSVGMYFIFLIGRDSPAVSLRSGVFSFAIVLFAIAVELGIVILTDNDPVARLMSVAIVTFIAGLLVVTTNTPPLGSTFGLIYCTVISLWELHAPADHLVKSSLYLLGTFCISLGSAIAVEYLFGVKNPAAALQEQRRIRYVALEALFRLYAEDAPPAQRFEAATKVSRIAIAGQAGMISLYNTIVERNLDTGTLPIAIRPRITMLAQLMDNAAAFGLQNPATIEPEVQLRCKRIADECKRLLPGVPTTPSSALRRGPEGSYSLLDRVEGSLHAILTMPLDINPTKNRELVTLPSHKVPFFVPGALRQVENIAFGLKISLCATFCYIFYHAVDWPGIQTSVTTVLVTGLSSTGAIKQKLIFRLLGAVIGGFILGIGATVFLYPHMDSITSLVVLESVVAFIAAWVAAGPKFNYIGLQIAFSFYVVSFEGLSAPTELAPARDRLAGILIALAAMWVVFDQLWPVRTITVMRRGFASVLRLGADILTLLDSGKEKEEILRGADILRDRLGKTVAGLRSSNTAVPYDFSPERDQHIREGDAILRATLTGAALFWNEMAMLHSLEEQKILVEPARRELRDLLAARMNVMADLVERDKPVIRQSLPLTSDSELLTDPQLGEYTQHLVQRYAELEKFVAALN